MHCRHGQPFIDSIIVNKRGNMASVSSMDKILKESPRIPKTKAVAYCHSERCNNPGHRTCTQAREIPEAKVTDIDCKRCGHVLYWQRVKV